MKIIVSPLVPRRFVVNLFGTIWTRSKGVVTPELMRHERIHTAQQRELLWVPFYIIYFIEWVCLLCKYHHWEKAYRALSFEREAYANQANPFYLSQRRHFAQWRGAPNPNRNR